MSLKDQLVAAIADNSKRVAITHEAGRRAFAETIVKAAILYSGKSISSFKGDVMKDLVKNTMNDPLLIRNYNSAVGNTLQHLMGTEVKAIEGG
jgi:hypothetical protein